MVVVLLLEHKQGMYLYLCMYLGEKEIKTVWTYQIYSLSIHANTDEIGTISVYGHTVNGLAASVRITAEVMYLLRL